MPARRPRVARGGYGFLRKLIMVAMPCVLMFTSGCAPHAVLAGLIAFAVMDSSTKRPKRRTPSQSPPRRYTHVTPSRPQPTARPAVIAHPAGNWRTYLGIGLDSYRRFQYKSSVEALSRVIRDPAASRTARTTARIYRGAAHFLLSNTTAAKSDFTAANRLGGKMDAGLFRPDLVRLYRRCAAIEM